MPSIPTGVNLATAADLSIRVCYEFPTGNTKYVLSACKERACIFLSGGDNARAMAQTRNELVDRLSKLASEIQAICDELSVTPAEVARINSPAEVAKRVAEGKCLNCGEKRPDGENRRGCDDACYSMLNGKKNRREATDAELVAAGLFLPAKKGGRNPAKPREGMGFTKLAKARERASMKGVAQQAAKHAIPSHKPSKP